MRFLAVLIAIAVIFPSSSHQFWPGFYDSSCPGLASIVAQVSLRRFQQLTNHPAQVLRLFFHDCFVEGCDGSILIGQTPQSSVERDSVANRDLVQDAFDTIDLAKQAVEAQCPGVVSCADILAMVTRDMLILARPGWNLALGRRDGTVSRADSALREIPSPRSGLDELLKNFHSKGLNLLDLVTLSGSHTLGVSHCSQFSQRLYGVNTSLDGTDPSLDPSFAKELKKDCPPGAPVTAIEFFDKAAPFTFDNHYFKNLEAGRSLLTSDESLLASFPSREIVRLFARDPPLFFFSFAASMDKLSRLGVKTGGAGEIRRSCNRFNAQ
ncbi:hypothetical protein SELMODRAFT_122262 [Selaginella moellendorffii]|uniref:Peroxidase n=1 Tax=Selaginella moellendorffii TaxID=88036 RepID=D8SPS6_SELML|nr:hypothetical protein SELMODRAFT_122262 [Selaginella moellendorffii]